MRSASPSQGFHGQFPWRTLSALSVDALAVVLGLLTDLLVYSLFSMRHVLLAKPSVVAIFRHIFDQFFLFSGSHYVCNFFVL